MSAHLELAYRPQVHRPVLVCAFGGWNDGGEAATTALTYARDRWSARRFAHVDPEEFFDFQVNRPTVHLEQGRTRRLQWPACEFFQARPSGRDVLLFLGVEPNVRWRTFCEQILSVCRDLRVELLVTLGAFLADVPHTRPAPVSAASADPGWAERLGVEPSRYEGPTGIVGVLNEMASRGGIAAVSLWAAAPHYLPSGTNPRVAVALLAKLTDLLGVEVDRSGLLSAVAVWEREVRRAVEEDQNLLAYVARLEELAAEQPEPEGIPSGDQLAAELERYLREQRGDGGS
ncbi:MAG: PAC2 family protein [Candidatus Velamenicoccus archaeovorus]